MQTFKIGDKVTWQSQSQGSWKTKVGTVARIVPPGWTPGPTVFRRLKSSGLPRDHESYVVLTDKSEYWPRVNKLTLVSA